MIEYYLFTHKGGEQTYNEGVFPIANLDLSIGIISSANLGENCARNVRIFKEILGSDMIQGNLSDLSGVIDKNLADEAEYMVLRISDEKIESIRRGGVYGKIVKDGELKVLPNGVMRLEDEDRIVCGTEEFFSNLADESILADSMFAESSQEWMEYLIRRISDVNWLSGGNLSAVTFIVRSGD